MNSTPGLTPDEPDESFDHSADQLIAELYAQFSGRLEKIAWAILRDWPLASDAVQEAFGLLARKWDEIPPDGRRGWLVKTVQFQAQNLRRKHRRAAGGHELLGQQSMTIQPPELERREAIEELYRAIQDLPEPQRIVVQKRLGEDKSFSEIATELKAPLGTVLSRMRLALQKLRSKLDDERYDDK